MQNFNSNDLKFTYSPLHNAIGEVNSGELFTVETEDCFTGKFRDSENFSSGTLAWVLENLDGVTGPIAVRGAKVGDVVAITLHEIEITTPGSVALSPCDDPSPSDWWSQWYGCKSFQIKNGFLHFSEDIKIPVQPLIGCIATAPDRETVLSKMQGPYGGNMDCTEMSSGSTIILPIAVPGAMIYFGDAKAIMGDGEIVQAPEVGTKITVSVELRPKPKAMNCPRVESKETLTTVVSDTTLDRAIGKAFAELLSWIEDDYDISRVDAALLLAMIAKTGVCQTANALHTGKCSVSRIALADLSSASNTSGEKN